MKGFMSLSCLLAAALPCIAHAGSVASARLLASDLTLVGELHGTRETPAWIAEIAAALSADRALVVGIEFPRAEQERLDRYMASRGTADDRAQLLAGPFWRGREGRQSVAMADLIDALRGLARAGRDVRVVALDDDADRPSHDAVMADALRGLRRARPQARILALMGNVHAAAAARDDRPDDAQPVGRQLRDLAPLTVLAMYGQGTAWVCMPDCGVHPLSSTWGRTHPAGWWSGDAPLPGYDAVWNLGPITASAPAVERIDAPR